MGATPEYLAPEIPIADESPSTTHFSVTDAQGMAVANTYTLEASWGSRIVVRGAGFVLGGDEGDGGELGGGEGDAALAVDGADAAVVVVVKEEDSSFSLRVSLIFSTLSR